MVSVRTLNDKVYELCVVSVLNLHGQCSSCIIIIVAVTCSFFASRDDSQTTHSYAIILTDSKELIKSEKRNRKPGLAYDNTRPSLSKTPADIHTVLDKLESKEVTEQIG